MLIEDINIDPDIWGPDFWHTIEAISCTLIPKNKKAILNFFTSIKDVIPCEKCREHYQKYFDTNPIQEYMQNSLTLLLWVYKLKTQIKNRQEKEIISFEEWINYIVNKYDMPELLYYMAKNEEYKNIMKNLGIKNSPFFDKYKIFEFPK